MGGSRSSGVDPDAVGREGPDPDAVGRRGPDPDPVGRGPDPDAVGRVQIQIQWGGSRSSGGRGPDPDAVGGPDLDVVGGPLPVESGWIKAHPPLHNTTKQREESAK